MKRGDYDVDGIDDVVGSVSSKDNRTNQPVDVEPVISHHNATIHSFQDKERPEKRRRAKRPRVTSSSADQQPGESVNEHQDDEPRKTLLDINHSDVLLIDYNMQGNQEQNNAVTALRPVEGGFVGHSQISASEFNNFSAIPSVDIMATQSMYVDGRPTVYPMMQNTELQHDDTCNFYNPSFEFGHSNDGQHGQIETNVPQIRPEVGGVHVPAFHRNENEITTNGGEMPHYINDTFHSEQERNFDHQFGSPLDVMPWMEGSFDDIIVDDFDDDLLKYFGA